MNQEISSATIGLISEALSKAQASIGKAARDSANPFFKSKYADLASIQDACQKPLSENGLSFTTSVLEYVLIATLSHSSGEWFRSYIPLMLGKQDMQGLVASTTYARRAALASMCNVATEDDDGNSTQKVVPESVKKEFLTHDQQDHIEELVEKVDDAEHIEKLCKFVNVKNLCSIESRDYERVVANLKKKAGIA